MDQPIIEQRTTLFGYDIQVSLKISSAEIVDVTHALRFDGNKLSVDLEVVTEAVQMAREKGFALQPVFEPSSKQDPQCTGPGFAHPPHGNCLGYSTDRT